MADYLPNMTHSYDSMPLFPPLLIRSPLLSHLSHCSSGHSHNWFPRKVLLGVIYSYCDRLNGHLPRTVVLGVSHMGIMEISGISGLIGLDGNHGGDFSRSKLVWV